MRTTRCPGWRAAGSMIVLALVAAACVSGTGGIDGKGGGGDGRPSLAALRAWHEVRLPLSSGQGPFACVAPMPGGGFVRIVEPAKGSNRPERLERSSDLRTWAPAGEFGTPGPGCFVHFAFDGRRYVLVGEEIAGTGPNAHQQPAIWTSLDLAHWTRNPTEPRFAWLLASFLAANERGFVLLGANKHGDSYWRSADGTSWTPISGIDGAVTGLAAVDGRFVAVGADATGAAAWMSEDGVAWTRVATPQGVGPIAALAAGPTGLLGISAAMSWASDAPPSGLAGGVMASPDGRTWRGWHAAAFDDAMVAYVVAIDGGYVAEGFDRQGCMVWTSSDGHVWACDELTSRLGGTPQLISDGHRAVVDLGGVLYVRDSLGS